MFNEIALTSGPDRLPVRSSELATRLQLHLNTVAEIVAFLATINLVEGTRHNCAVTKAGWDIAEAYRNDETQGRLLLLAQFRNHWAVQLTYSLAYDAPVEQATLAGRISDTTGVAPRRAHYLLDWLVVALVLHQDPSMQLSPSAAYGVPISGPRRGPNSVDPPGLLMGLTPAELRALPPERYQELLKQLPALYDLNCS
ncbi:hypothetical protein ACFCZ6_32410 [Streptomyces hydrogenans]|uniref:hypothetical protein n=1 Tax=Streptomyces hydrogenans TaxID=1873719 RepID=UPI0035D94935